MTLVAHAITPAPAVRSPGEPGLRGLPLELSRVGDLAMWSTRWDRANKLEPRDALDHHRIVERICRAQPCLPVRFGTVFADEGEASASLEKRAAQLRASLGRVAGRSELALTLLWRDPSATSGAPASASGPGRRYLEERRAQMAERESRKRRAEALAERVIAELATERPLVWHDTCTAEAVALSLAVLVPTPDVETSKAKLARIAGGFSDVNAIVNGPWPPYTFAGIE
jgi:hypothetical protein